jgi:hypothetical protein
MTMDHETIWDSRITQASFLLLSTIAASAVAGMIASASRSPRTLR